MEIFVNNVKVPYNDIVSLRFANPLFNDINGYSLPMTFNARLPAVQKAFGFPSLKDAEVKSAIPGEIRSEYINLVGSWRITRAGSRVIEAAFKSGSGDFYSLIKDKYLNEINFGGLKDLPADMLDANSSIMDTYYPESKIAAFCAYVKNMPGANEVVDGIVNFVSLDENGDPFFNPTPLSTGNSVYLFVGAVIEYMFAEFGYKVEKDIFKTDPDLCRLVVFNTYNIRIPVYSDDYVNNMLRVDYSKLVPRIACGDFIKALRNRFNIGFFINEEMRSVNIRSFKEVIAKGTSNANIRCGKYSVENNRLEGLKFPFVAADEYSSHAITSFDELNNVTEVNKYRDILPATRDDGDLIFVKSERTYYRIKFTSPATYEAIKLCTDDLQYTEGNASEEFEQLSCIPAMFTFTTTLQYNYLVGEEPAAGETQVDYLVPRCDLVGNRTESEFTTFPLMFLFARGIAECYTVPAEGAPVYKYPFGTSDLFDAAGDAITGSMTLKWDGTYGIIEKLWLSRIAWELNIKKLLTPVVLNSDVSKLIRFDKAVRIGNDNCLVNSFGLELSNKLTRIIDCELLRL